MSTERERSTRGVIAVADLAVELEDYDRAEDALHLALSHVRKKKAYRGENE